MCLSSFFAFSKNTQEKKDFEELPTKKKVLSKRKSVVLLG